MSVRRIALAALLALGCLHVEAALYAVTLRGSQGQLGGKLYKVDPRDATSVALCTFELEGQPIGLRGIAIHPKTRVFYGITAGFNRAAAASLVTLDPATGKAKVVGRLGHLGSDLNFDAAGKLYIWLTERNQLGTVNLGTGEATPLAPSGLAQTIGGGFAIRGDGAAVISATSAAGTVDHVDLATGRVTTGPGLSGAPFVSALLAMDFSPDRRLYAVNTNLGTPAAAALVLVDPESGRVTRIGPLPDDATAIAFGDDEDAVASTLPRTYAGSSALVLAAALSALAGVAVGFVVGRRHAQREA